MRSAEQLRQAIKTNPRDATALYELGIMAYDAGDLAQAIELLARVAQIETGLSFVHYNLGIVLIAAEQPQRAVESLRRALNLQPNDAMALNALGTAYTSLGHLQDACDAFLRAIALQPEHAQLHSNLGSALQHQGRLDEAIASFRWALELKPNYASMHTNLLLCLNYHDKYSPQEIFAEHLEYGRRQAVATTAQRSAASKDGRIRVGYVSPDFRSHSVAFFIWPILEHHDRSRVEVTCYSTVAQPDAITQILRQFPEHWRDVAGMSDADLARQIAADNIEILIDLAGHTAANRLPLFAQRPAPIQVTYLGYPNTTGLDAMDYRLTDAYADPIGATESLHSEKLLRLPDAFFCYMPPSGCPDLAPPPAIANTHVTFGVFTNYSKVRPNMMRLWAQILGQLPGSRLVLQAKSMDDPFTRDATLQTFAAAGIAPERIDLRGFVPFSEYIPILSTIDIALDTHPFNGHTTSCHALWMGVPIVTLAGETHRSRMGLSLLTNLNLQELVTTSESDYVRVAVELARDLPRLTRLRATMRSRMQNSPILDGRTFCRNLEAAYAQM